MAEMVDCTKCGKPTDPIASNPVRKELGLCARCFESWIPGVPNRAYVRLAPVYSRSRVNGAGRALAKREGLGRDYSEDFKVISDWRSAHKAPMDALHRGLKNLAQVLSRSDHRPEAEANSSDDREIAAGADHEIIDDAGHRRMPGGAWFAG